MHYTEKIRARVWRNNAYLLLSFFFVFLFFSLRIDKAPGRALDEALRILQDLLKYYEEEEDMEEEEEDLLPKQQSDKLIKEFVPQLTGAIISRRLPFLLAFCLPYCSILVPGEVACVHHSCCIDTLCLL